MAAKNNPTGEQDFFVVGVLTAVVGTLHQQQYFGHRHLELRLNFGGDAPLKVSNAIGLFPCYANTPFATSHLRIRSKHSTQNIKQRNAIINDTFFNDFAGDGLSSGQEGAEDTGGDF